MESLVPEFHSDVPFPLLRTETGACPYLPDREMSLLIALVSGISGDHYRHLMDKRFRRTGTVYYRPDCPACQACVPIRVPVARFVPSRSQTRAARRNADVCVTEGDQCVDDEHYDLFRRYQLARHAGQMLEARAEFEEFLGSSLLESFEPAFRLAGRLIAVSVLDCCADALSSVYCYYDPDEPRRSLGVYTGLQEIEACRRRGLDYWYIGYHIAGCRKMEYKARFRPCELLQPDGTWRTIDQ